MTVFLQKLSFLSRKLTIFLKQEAFQLLRMFKLFMSKESVEVLKERLGSMFSILPALKVDDSPEVFLRKKRNNKTPIF